MVRRTHSHSLSPAPSSTPSLQQHTPPPPNAPGAERMERAGKKLGREKRTNQRRVTGQGRPRSPQTVQSAKR